MTQPVDPLRDPIPGPTGSPGPMNPREIPFQDQLNDVGGWLDPLTPGDNAPLGDRLAQRFDGDPSDNHQSSTRQYGNQIFESIADAITEGLGPLASVAKLADKIADLWMPTNIVRCVSGILGVFFVGFAIFLLFKEMKASDLRPA
ncbi:hypothetical protein JIG36_51090 [Actinoplanes sp. LDG1-06]|uniref:Uncharacterized protein n=1 Tax=Paractinoplanes ovalisporus TaxID=2810368 RepID=A0ABS2AVG3_9ACTN|nr:hypothetical protein [Actinoplanes ovalisporus]MBM2623865.1 hypothetical protein [Actinoplanes ovalisporus]